MSLSNSYPEFAKALIISFYQHYFKDKDQLATAEVPYHIGTDLQQWVNDVISGVDYDADFKAMRVQLAHMNVSIPTLYKQYADLCEMGGVRFIDFSIDADFGNCIDGLVMVDLRALKPAKYKRYLAD